MARSHYTITLADALEAHEAAMEIGGRPGVASLPLLESAIARPYSGYYRPIERKAAALMHSVVNNHSFIDGNKRTALILTELLIERSGYELILKSDDVFDDVIVDVARGNLGFDDLAVWFGNRLVKVT